MPARRLDASLLLVPTERHVEVELSRRPLALSFAAPGLSVRTFRGLVVETAATLLPGLSPASAQATRLAARAALDALPRELLRRPDEAASRAALAEAVDRALGRLRRAGTSAAHLAALGEPEAALLGEVLTRVDALLERARLFDPRGAGAVLARLLHGAGAADAALAHGAATVTGILAWEADDLAALEAIHAWMRARGGAGARVVLPRPARPGDAVEELADALERRWASLLDAPEIEWQAARAPGSDGEPQADGDDAPSASVTVLAAKDAGGEARAVVAAILGELAAGTAPERIAVVVPALDDARLEPLRAAFADAGLPLSEPRGRPVTACPEGRLVLVLLALAAGPVTREQVIDLLRAPGVHAGSWMERPGELDAAARAGALAHQLREVPVEIDRTGHLLLDGLVAALEGRRDGSAREKDAGAPAETSPRNRTPPNARDDLAEAWMPRALERLLASVRKLGSVATRAGVARRLLALVDVLKLGAPSARELSGALRREGRGGPETALRALGEGAAAVRALRGAVEELVAASGALGLAEQACGVDDFAAELERVAEGLGTGLGAGATRAGAVRLAQATELAGLEHDVLVVTGLVESAYGGGEGEDLLLEERDRARLPAPCRPPSARERGGVRRAELDWALAGSPRVILSWSVGEETEPDTPHPLVAEAEARAKALGVRTRLEPASRVARGAARLDARSTALIALVAGATPGPEIAERARIERARTAFFLDPRAPAGPFTGWIPAEAGPRASGERAPPGPGAAHLAACIGGASPDGCIAVTAIEKAAGCAFAGFAKRVLRVRRTDDLVEVADARERGTLIHRALHAAFDAMARLPPSAGDRERREVARSAAQQALGVTRSLGVLRREALTQVTLDVLAAVTRSLEAAEPARFFAAERRFGGSEAAPWGPLELAATDATPGPSVFVDGQIDRIDRTPDGRLARVVDYKSGKPPSEADHGRLFFQLPLYAAVVARALEPEVVEALYVSVRQRGLVEEWPRGEPARQALAARGPELAEEARRVVLSLWQGAIEPRPLRANLCVRCEARDVCRRPAVAPIEEEERG